MKEQESIMIMIIYLLISVYNIYVFGVFYFVSFFFCFKFDIVTIIFLKVITKVFSFRLKTVQLLNFCSINSALNQPDFVNFFCDCTHE